MDEQEPDVKPGDALPDTNNVYRIIVRTIRKNSDNFMPSVSSFSLSDADKEDSYRLSTDWDKKTTPEETIARVGCSHKPNGEWKPYQNREIYALTVSFLNGLDSITAVIYNPVFNHPPVFGRPDNPAHSSICFKPETFDEYAPYLFTKLRDYAKEKKVSVNMEEVDKIVSAYRGRYNSVAYKKCISRK